MYFAECIADASLPNRLGDVTNNYSGIPGSLSFHF